MTTEYLTPNVVICMSKPLQYFHLFLSFFSVNTLTNVVLFFYYFEEEKQELEKKGNGKEKGKENS